MMIKYSTREMKRGKPGPYYEGFDGFLHKGDDYEIDNPHGRRAIGEKSGRNFIEELPFSGVEPSWISRDSSYNWSAAVPQ